MEKSIEDLRQELFELIEDAYSRLCPEYIKRGPAYYEMREALGEWAYQTAEQIGPDYTMEDAKAEAEDWAKQDAERYADMEN